MFFFEKKNQKTFHSFGSVTWHRLGPNEKKSFCFFFFRKRRFFSSMNFHTGGNTT